jgi:hypothetical protein
MLPRPVREGRSFDSRPTASDARRLAAAAPTRLHPGVLDDPRSNPAPEDPVGRFLLGFIVAIIIVIFVVVQCAQVLF